MSVLFLGILLCSLVSGFSGTLTVFGDDSSGDTNGSPDSWPMFHKDLAHSGYTSSAGPLTNETKWSYATDPILSSPTVTGGIVYVGTNSGKLLALNASNGAVIWSYQTGGAVYSSPTVADNVVYFGSWDNIVYALNALTGAVLWSYKTSSYVQSSPAVANGVVYIASYDANVSALDAATGNLLWSFRTGAGAVGASPAVINGLVYIGDNGGRVWALNAVTGTAIWRFTAGDTVYSSPTVVNGVVYIGGDLFTNGTIFALDASTGAQLWNFPTGNLWVYSTPSVANGVVYVGSHDHLTSSNSGLLYALSAATGKMMWSCPLGTEVYSSPIVADDVVYAGGGDDNFYALNASTGATLWSYHLDGADSWSSAAVASGVLYVGLDKGTLFAFGPLNSTATPIPAPTPTPVTQSNATVPATTDNGKRVNLPLSGNITSTQMSNVTIAVNNATTTGLFFKVTGENGTIGFSNITITKNLVPIESTPVIFVDGEPAQNQGYTQDQDNYYVWYSTHFSTHEIAIVFSAASPSPSPSASQNQGFASSNLLQVIYGLVAAVVVVTIVIVTLKLVIMGKQDKNS